MGENIVMARVRRATLIRLIHRFEPVGNTDKLVTNCNEVNHERRGTQAERRGTTEGVE